MTPKTVIFGEVKSAVDYVKCTILCKAGLPDIDIAVCEWTVTFSSGPKIPSLSPTGSPLSSTTPFPSTLGLVIAPLKESRYECPVTLYLHRGNGSDDVLASTPVHVVRPPSMRTSKHREEIVAKGDKALDDSTIAIETRTGTLQENIESRYRKVERPRQQQADSTGERERTARALQVAQQAVDNPMDDIQQPYHLHTPSPSSRLPPTIDDWPSPPRRRG